MQIILTSFDEYIELEDDASYVEIAGSADYTTIEGPDGDVIPLATVASVGFIGSTEEYVDVVAGGEAVGVPSATVDVVEPAPAPLEVVTLGEVTNVTKILDGVGFNFEHVDTATTPSFIAEESTIYLCDTTAGPMSIEPFTPQADGEWFGIWDAGGAFATNHVTVSTEGRTFQTIASELVMNCSNTGVLLVSEGNNWNVFALSRFGQEALATGAGELQNFFIQQAQPVADPPWVWYELDGAGNLANIKVGL